MSFVIPSLTANRNALLMANLTRDASAVLSDKEMALVLPPAEYDAYLEAKAKSKERIKEALAEPATVGAEAAYYWSQAAQFIREAYDISKMAQATPEQKSAKRGASAKLQGKADDLVDLWHTVPASDRDKFRKLAVDGVRDTGHIPGITITHSSKGKALTKAQRVTAALVQPYAIWVIQSEFEQDPRLFYAPWFEQLEALEAHLGSDIADQAPCLLDELDQHTRADFEPEHRPARPDDVDVTATVRKAMDQLAAKSAQLRD